MKALGTLLKVLGAVMLVLLLIGFLSNLHKHDETSTPLSNVDANATQPVNAIRLASTQLWTSYHANEVAADQRYKGQPLIVSGIVESIDKSLFDSIVIRLATVNEFESVMATMRKDQENRAAALTKGTPVLVSCTGGGMIMGSPSLDDCVFVEGQQQEPRPTASESTPAPNPGPAPQTPKTSVQIGDTEEQMLAILGPPSSVTTGAERIFTYPQGRLWIVDGKVAKIEKQENSSNQ